MDERAKRIADGLAAAEKGQKDLAQAKTKAEELIREARARAVQIEDQARHRANELIDQAKGAAIAEGERLIAAAQQQIQLEGNARARRAAPAGRRARRVGASQAARDAKSTRRRTPTLLNKLAAQI